MIIIKKERICLILLATFSFTFIIFYIFITNIFKNSIYVSQLKEVNSEKYISIASVRGKIFDRNGIVIVDNIKYNNLVYRAHKNNDEIAISKKLAIIFEFETPSIDDLISWYKANNDEEKLLNTKEKKLIEERKISSEQKTQIINNRITNIVNKYEEKEKEYATVYGLMTKGYYYETKIIVENISDEEINKVIDANIAGISIESAYKRYYPYKKTLKSILGNVGKISKEEKEFYLKNGYELNDIIGISQLEKQYESYLKGEKGLYKVNDDNSLTLIKSPKKGKDIYLSIDINLEQKIDEIIQKELAYAKNYPNTQYLTDSYAIVSIPSTGEILSINGQRMIKDNYYTDIAINNISSSFTMGSAVKGATIAVGYKYNLIDYNEKIYDSCVKLKNQTQKCSYRPLGYLNDISALKHSSNYYQFMMAIRLAKNYYYPNMELKVTKKEFDIYRNMLASFGLGTLSGIDLPNEKLGITGKTIAPDLLLNLAIGQYDTYTPIQMLTYINTIANSGNRIQPGLVSYVKDQNEIVYKRSNNITGKADITENNLKRVINGFYEVVNGGTGNGFMNKKILPAGKTGTSESFLDSNNDGIVDTKTYTLTMVGFFPYENPMYSIVVICPHSAVVNDDNDYVHYIISRISHQITDFMFENMLIN